MSVPQAVATVREVLPPSTEEAVAIGASDFLRLIRRSMLLIGGSAVATVFLAAAYLAHQTPLYRATSEILVDPQALQIVGKDIVRNDTAASIDFANIDSQALVMVSNTVLDQLADELKLDDDPAFRSGPGLLASLLGDGASPKQTRVGTLENLRRSIVVRRVDNSLVFDLTVSHPRSDRAALIANRLATVYLRQGTEGRGAAVKRASDTLLNQLAVLRAQLNTAETSVEKFRSDNGLVSTGEAGLIVNQQIKDIYTQITTAETDLARLSARKDQLAKLGPDALLSDRIPEALNSPTITALRSQYAESARETARLAETVLAKHPRLIEARGELQATRKLLSDELDRIRASILQDYQQAQANLGKLRERAKSLTQSQALSSEAEIKLRQLESEADAIKSVYNASLDRAKELEQQEKIETNNSRLISLASPPLKPAKAPAAIVLPAAALFGACLGIAIAFLLDLLKGAASNPRSVADMFGVDTFVSFRRRPGSSALDERDRAGIVSVARRLQSRVGTRNPAIVLVAGAEDLDPAARRNVIWALGRSFAELGEGVWICVQGDHAAPVHVERIEPVTIDDGLAPANGLLSQALRTALQLQVMEALRERSSTRGPGSNILLLCDEHPAGLPASASAADAIVLLFETGRTRRSALRDLVAMIDPTTERVAAVIGVQPAKTSIMTSGRRAERPRKAYA